MAVPASLLGEEGWSRHAAFLDQDIGGHDFKHDKDKNRYENQVLKVKDCLARSWSFLLRLYDESMRKPSPSVTVAGPSWNSFSASLRLSFDEDCPTTGVVSIGLSKAVTCCRLH